MSFIYDDPNLINQLLASGLDHAVKFTKKGQAAAAAVQQDRANLLSLIKNLQDQLNPAGAQKDPNVGPTISYEGGAGKAPRVDVTTLESLGDLIQWLAANKVTVGGQRVSYEQDPGNKSYIFYRLPVHMNDPALRTQQNPGIFVNHELLKSYLTYLQGFESKNPNPTMRFQLGRIINEANTNLGANLSTQYQEPEKIVPDTYVLDDVPRNFVGEGHAVSGGDVPLTYGDMKNDMTFNNWLATNSISQTSKENANQPIGINHPNFNRCLILNILADRARARYSGARDVAMRERAIVYVRQVSFIKQQANCPSVAETSTPNMQGGKPEQNGQAGQGHSGSAGGNESELIGEIVSDLPLQQANIDFSRIRRFMSSVGKLMGNNSTIQQYISHTETMMDEITSKMENGDTRFDLGIGPEALTHMFKEKRFPGRDFYRIVQLLDQVVDNVRAMVSYFLSGYQRKLPEQAIGHIYGQIGNAATDRDTIYNDNITALDKWARTPHT